MSSGNFTVKNCRDCAHAATFTYTASGGTVITFPACAKDSMPLMKEDHQCNTFEAAGIEEKNDV